MASIVYSIYKRTLGPPSLRTPGGSASATERPIPDKQPSNRKSIGYAVDLNENAKLIGILTIPRFLWYVLLLLFTLYSCYRLLTGRYEGGTPQVQDPTPASSTHPIHAPDQRRLPERSTHLSDTSRPATRLRSSPTHAGVTTNSIDWLLVRTLILLDYEFYLSNYLPTAVLLLLLLIVYS